MPAPDPHDSHAASWLTLAAIVVLGLPTLVFSYLPMTDLPQHLAIASILEHHGDPSFGFATHYSVDVFHTPYLLPYALMLAFGKLMPLTAAMHVVVFLSVIAYPVGVLLLLRAAGKPSWLALLALPLVYNRALFWGFINFNLSIGLAIAAFAFAIDPRRSRLRTAVQVVLVAASILSHIYGLAMLIGLVGLYAVCGGYRVLRERVWSLVPIVVGVALWAWTSRESHGYGETIVPGLGQRIRELPSSILGGYQDASEGFVLLVLVAAVLALTVHTIPVTRARLRAATPVERTCWGFFVANLLLYFVLPQATWTAKFIHFRHAFLALALLPVAATATFTRMRMLRFALPAIAAGVTVLSTWGHLALFDQEAGRFGEVVDALPMNPKVVSLVFDVDGGIMATHPYMHFAAYAQAEKGGLISFTFPDVFWNLPVIRNPRSPAPHTPEGFEWNPRLYNERAFGHYYDYALVRLPTAGTLASSPAFPFEPIKLAPPWQLYQRVSSTGRPTRP